MGRKLHIYVDQMQLPDGSMQTVSKFGKPDDWSKVVFHNACGTEYSTTCVNQQLTIDIDKPALCDSNTQPGSFPVTIDARNKEGYLICSGYSGAEFKYTAMIAGAAPEDPIIIIERSRFLDVYGTLLLFAGAAILAFIAGTLFGIRRGRRRMAPPA